MPDDIPATTTCLPEGLPNSPQLVDRGNMRQGKNSRRTLGYFGPRPPANDPPHRYHFQVFAVDAVLDVLPGADKGELLRALKGHVTAHGETIGTFEGPKDKS